MVLFPNCDDFLGTGQLSLPHESWNETQYGSQVLLAAHLERRTTEWKISKTRQLEIQQREKSESDAYGTCLSDFPQLLSIRSVVLSFSATEWSKLLSS